MADHFVLEAGNQFFELPPTAEPSDFAPRSGSAQIPNSGGIDEALDYATRRWLVRVWAAFRAARFKPTFPLVRTAFIAA